jgi:hypothetical protein
MADFQLLSCRIQLAGSKDSVVYRGAHNPLSYPEILIMQFMHGDDAVTEIAEVGSLNMSNLDLLHHLQLTYPKEAVQQCFPGARPNLTARSDEFPKARAVLLAAQDARDAKMVETPGPGPSLENMNIPEPTPKAKPHRDRTAHAADRVSSIAGGRFEEGDDAGPFA